MNDELVSEKREPEQTSLSFRHLTLNGTAGLESAMRSMRDGAPIVIDFARVSQASPEGLALLVRFARQRGPLEEKIAFINVSLFLKTVFSQSGLDRIFEIS